jgi:hypothetical protein
MARFARVPATIPGQINGLWPGGCVNFMPRCRGQSLADAQGTFSLLKMTSRWLSLTSIRAMFAGSISSTNGAQRTSLR